MEKWLSYKQSKSMNKSLSYLSGVGEDLSFDISYFMRLSKCSARYYDGALFLGFSKTTFINEREEFGELFERRFDDTSHFLFGEKYIKKEFFIYDLSKFASRFRDSRIDICEHFDYLSSDKGVTIHHRQIGLQDNIKSGIYTTDSIPIYKVNKSVYYKFSHLFAQDNTIGDIDEMTNGMSVGTSKQGLQSYATEKSLSGKESESTHESEDVSVFKLTGFGADTSVLKFASQNDKNLTYTDEISVSNQTINIIVDSQINADSVQPEATLQKDAVDVTSTSTNVHVNSSSDTVDHDDKYVAYQDSLNVSIPIKNVSIDNYLERIGDNTSEVILEQSTSVGIPVKNTVYDLQESIGHQDNELIMSERHLILDSELKSAHNIYDDLLVGSIDKEAQHQDPIIVGNNNKDLMTSTDFANYVSSNNKTVNEMDKYNSAVSQHGKELSNILASEAFLSKHIKQTYYDDSGVVFDKNIKSISSEESYVISKHNKSLFMYDTLYSEKDNKSQFMYDTLEIHRDDSRGIFTSMAQVMFKYSRTINDSTLRTIYTTKSTKSLEENVSDMVDRLIRNGVFYDEHRMLSKNGMATSLNEDYNSLFRNIPYCMDYLDFSHAISKVSTSIGGTDDSTTVSKSPYTIENHDTEQWFKKNHKAISENFHEKFVDKASRKISQNDSSELFDKAYVDANINMDGNGVSKSYRPTELDKSPYTADKNYRDTNVKQTGLWFKLPFVEYRVNSLVLMAYKNYRDANATNEIREFVPESRAIDADYDPTNFNTLRDFAYYKQQVVERSRDTGIVTDNHISAKVEDLNGFVINPEVHASPIARNTQFDRQNGFAYTDKTDYALIKDDRIDELQLPASDFNYDNFAKKLFVDGSIDQKYIKREDEYGNLYINLPIENPIKHFADLAIEYVDLNVGMLIYIIEKAYNIWQNKIFTYSAMPSDTALNDILKRLKDGLYIQYPSEEDQYHLHRAIRLFRWYAEMSILNNAEYMLKLRYKTLEVDYANKDLKPFSDISVFDNMHIDNTFVLAAIDNTLPCGFTIEIQRGHKVRLKFLAAITGGNCVINVNGNSDIYTEQMLEFDEELDAGHNIITVSFEPTSSSAHISIMKLAIKNYSITSYDVSYVGKIGESNMTINHLISMLSVCGDSIDMIQKTVAHATPTANALEQMRVYFELHHEDKLKGRRLITKH